jgi:hypothetical protein
MQMVSGDIRRRWFYRLALPCSLQSAINSGSGWVGRSKQEVEFTQMPLNTETNLLDVTANSNVVQVNAGQILFLSYIVMVNG